MMSDRKNFVLAVIVALGVPLTIGGAYFYKMYCKKSSTETIAQLTDKKEFVVFGDDHISKIDGRSLSDAEREEAAYLEFEVVYASGKDEIGTYTIELVNIQNPMMEDLSRITWQLVKLDGDANYTVAKGNFASANDKLKLCEAVDIGIKETHKYKLYYYPTIEISNNNRISAKLVIE